MCDTAVNCTAEYYGLTIDVGRKKLYYADISDPMGKVGELSTNGTDHRVLITANNSRPHAVVLDDVNRFGISILHQRNITFGKAENLCCKTVTYMIIL